MRQPDLLSDDDRALLEDYVLQALSPEAARSLEERLQDNAALQQELQALQATLRLLPLGLPLTEPAADLRDRILAAHAEHPQGLAVDASVPSQRLAPSLTDLSLPVSRWPWAKWVAGLVGILALLLAADNWRLRQALNVAQQEPVATVAGILQQPNSRLVTLEGTTEAAAVGTLLFTPGQWQQVIVSLGNLPPLPPEEVYRMWLSLENGQVIFCGEFNTDAQGNVFVELRPATAVPQGVKAQGVFVTVDPKTAPLEPTGEPVLAGSI
jgi:hypothetical protein